MRILTISGSLRAASSNTAVLEAAAILAPPGVEVVLFDGLADLPPFNPDHDSEPALPAVAEFRSQLRAADAVLISSPEYAHGVPGVLKNALDWVVGSGELAGKPAALINTSPRATHAQASLMETLTVMTANLVAAASITLPLPGRKLDASGIAGDAELAGALRQALAALESAVAVTAARASSAG